jgi:Histidine kinase-like ATPase domain
MEIVETQFPSSTTTPTAVRAFLRAALGTWELDGFGNVAELLTDELVSNVVRHVNTPMTVRALRQPTWIRVEVDDPSPTPPVLQHPGAFDDHGRGLLLVDGLANRWGTTVRADGKTVWFEIDTATATEEIHQNGRDLPSSPRTLPT